MEAIYALHVLSIFSYQQSIAEDPTGEGSRNHHCSEMANPNMVACLDENADRQSSTTTLQKETTVSSKQPRNDSPYVSKTGAADVPLVRRSLERKGISTEASRIIMQSWRSGTTTQYQTYHKKWESFCCRRHINPLQATLQDGINFLGDLFATGVGYSCINTARSVLSSIIVLPGSVHFGNHQVVTRFVKGVFETRPSLPQYKEIWDVNSVLKALATWTLGVELSLKNVMAKAGIDTSVYKAHSTRAAVTSAAKGKQVPIDTILSTAGWSSESTFARFYDKPIQDTAKNFGHELMHNSCSCL